MSVSGSSEELRGGLTDPLHSGSDGFVMPTTYVRRIHAANVGSCADADVSFATALKPPTGVSQGVGGSVTSLPRDNGN